MLLTTRNTTKPQGMAGTGAAARMEPTTALTQHITGCGRAYRFVDVRNSGIVRPQGPLGGRTG